MATLGTGLLVLALATSGYGVVVAMAAGLGARPAFHASARRAAYAVAALSTAAFVLVEIAFLRNDLSFALVASHSSSTTPLFYKATAMWSSQEGSMLLWLWLLSLWTALILRVTKDRMRDVQPWATAVLLGFATFFAALLVFKVSPFDTLASPPAEGAGLNPLLRYPSMMTHPPMLYAGYTLWAVPFAFAVGALIVRRVDAEWLVVTRRFALGAWLCLGIGILLGARWSYAELGWGGYWAWDPVENASLLPWLTGTAFIHSAMVQEKRGMLKVWNASLILATGTLAVLGTFLVRSGIIQSIHAFTGSELGWHFLTLIVAMVVISVWLVVSRRGLLATENRLDSLLSREAMFLANNLVLVAMAFVVLWGTFFPLTSEIMSGTEQTLGPPWYGRYVTPLALMLVALTAVGPLVPWRRTSWRLLRRPLVMVGIAGLAATVVVLLLGGGGRPLAVTFLGVSGAAVATVVLEYVRGVRARRTIAGERAPAALLSLLRRNRRRYGGYLVHLGIVVMLVGVAASSAFQRVDDVRLKPGDTVQLKDGYSVRYERPTARVFTLGDEIEKIGFGARLTLLRDGREVEGLHPTREYYPMAGAPADRPLSRYFEGESTSEIAMRTSLVRDVWIAMTPDTSRVLKAVEEGDPKLAAVRDDPAFGDFYGAAIGAVAGSYVRDAPPASFRMIVSPMVRWVWIGGFLTIIGTLICLVPFGEGVRRRERARYVAKVAEEVRG